MDTPLMHSRQNDPLGNSHDLLQPDVVNLPLSLIESKISQMPV